MKSEIANSVEQKIVSLHDESYDSFGMSLTIRNESDD